MPAAHGSPASLLTFVAFSADCRHEVRPVTTGYGVVLTDNSQLNGTPAVRDHRARQVI